jgi:hypothetical protein
MREVVQLSPLGFLGSELVHSLDRQKSVADPLLSGGLAKTEPRLRFRQGNHRVTEKSSLWSRNVHCCFP